MPEELMEKAMQYSRENGLLAPGDRVLVALSGGADSVCLLLVLQDLAAQLSLTLGAFHVNHGIRGAEADADEAFCRGLCRRLGVPLTVVKADVPGEAEQEGIGLEEAGRLVRYREAERLLAEQGYTRVALAHHQGDVAETFLFHLFRGSSLTGLASIPARRGRFIRPLLFCSKEEILSYLGQRGEPYCMDSTNADTEYARNRIRQEILPAAEKINAGARRHIAEAAGELSELSDYLEQEAEAVCRAAKRTPEEIRIPVVELLTGPHVLQARAAFRLLAEAAGQRKDLTRLHVEQLLSLCTQQSGRSLDFPHGVTARLSFGTLILEKRKPQRKPEEVFKGSTAGEREESPEENREEHAEEILVEVPGTYLLTEPQAVLQLRCFPAGKNVQIPKNEYTKWFDYDKIKGALKLRTRKKGDVIGMLQGRKSLKQVFTEKKIDTKLRSRLLLLADDRQVLWIPGVRACDNYRVDASTVTILEIQMNGGQEDEG